MPTEKYTAGTSRGTVLATELNALAAGNQSAQGTAIDNATNLDRYGMGELSVAFGSNPTADGTVDLYGVTAPDGSNYGDGNATLPVSQLTYLGSFLVQATTAAQRIQTPAFEMPGPFLTKFIVKNNTSQAFPASGTTVKLFTFNRQTT
jgi:hypothetical protein